MSITTAFLMVQISAHLETSTGHQVRSLTMIRMAARTMEKMQTTITMALLILQTLVQRARSIGLQTLILILTAMVARTAMKMRMMMVMVYSTLRINVRILWDLSMMSVARFPKVKTTESQATVVNRPL